MNSWAPVYFYWALILFGVLPLAPINRVAAIVVAARVACQVTYDAGFPEPETQTVIFGAAAILSMHNARLTTCFLSAALFVPMAIASAWQVAEPVTAFWWVYWLGVAQAVILLISGEWRKAIRHWLDASRAEPPEWVDKMVAWARRAVRLHA